MERYRNNIKNFDDYTLLKMKDEIDFEVDNGMQSVSYARYKELRDRKEIIINELEERGYNIN